jgi:hypothetical protein
MHTFETYGKAFFSVPNIVKIDKNTQYILEQAGISASGSI